MIYVIIYCLIVGVLLGFVKYYNTTSIYLDDFDEIALALSAFLWPIGVPCCIGYSLMLKALRKLKK